jgi:hypothetical protein
VAEAGKHRRAGWSEYRAAIVRRSGAPLGFPTDEPHDDAYLDAIANATGLPRGPVPSAADRAHPRRNRPR